MKKEQSIINKDDFFAGKLTNEQEKKLRNDDKDSFFETLKDEKEIKMELSFDDFMTKVEENQPKVLDKSKTKEFTLWKISGIAASVLIVVGLFFFLNQTNESQKNQEIVKTIEPQKKELEVVNNKEEKAEEKPIFTNSKINNIETKDEVVEIVKVTKSIKKENKKSNIQSIESEIKSSENTEEYSSDFVIVNGQPVENLEEAKALAYSTMKLFSKNVDQGVKAIGQLKALPIEL
ncbi:hypothetical protein [Empedobacter brevis]|uniref:hypothetical protein n=1 Tax=Empedobacter brevis TaxID=247 RepID=UPI0039AF80A2